MNWQEIPRTLKIAAQEAHIYRASLDVVQEERERYWQYLTAQERARAERFVVARDKQHFVAARGILRELLGRYLERAPESIELEANTWGKPGLPGRTHRASLYFNLSHSRGMAVYVFCGEGQVGIDVEEIRTEIAAGEIAQRYFSAGEIQELQALPAESRGEGFFLCWTRKEAYIKARGEGLRIPLNSFDVSLTPGQPATLRSSDGAAWKLISFALAAKFVAACVVPRGVQVFRYLQLGSSRETTQP